MATIYDVAALAGVSPATVSRVFNGRTVSDDRAQRVRDAAASLSFTPNRTARTLRRQSSEVIALIIPDIQNPFFTALARGVEDRAQSSGYSVVLCNTDDDPVKEARYLQIAISENMAGVVLVPASDSSDLSIMVGQGRPVVTVDRTTAFDVDHVMIDNRPAGASVTGSLFDAGYTRIACIAGPESVVTAIERAGGWRETVESRGAYDADPYLKIANHRVDGGRAAMAELLDLPDAPDAVVATNNLMGVGALQVLNERGLTPPAFGVGVIGGLPFTTLSPGLITLVHLPTHDLGTTAVSMLVSRIDGATEPARTVVLPGVLTAATTAATRDAD
ncbi:LacI family transcriptional regulator [Mycetocola sp. CAN_C7]|uniref:LacI family DNA-binding transcriptional regulator n=1 Tax=Mycetocola sp. CAN_C7 TaxID=2787724 RepID=UPI0018CA4291